MTCSWINKLNESDSRLHKEKVISQALAASELGSDNADLFLRMTKLCYDPFTTFGIKQVPTTEGIVDAENPWDEFETLLDLLSTRCITGNEARDNIEELSEKFDSDEWNNFCRAVIRRDLRAGISEKTVNKICKDTQYQIPTFSCQLATDSKNRPEMQGKKRLEPKLDGVRVLMFFWFSGSAVSYSRNGKVFDNFQHIEQEVLDNIKELQKLLTKDFAEGFVLDGEVVGNSFQELMRQARRKTNVQSQDSVFHVFDILPISDFKRGHWNAQLYKRLAVLNKISPVIDKMDSVELIPHIEVDLDTKEGVKQLEKYSKNMVSEGFEGIMIKNINAPYECTRNKFWLKLKPVLTVDLEVVGIEEGTGRNEGRLGALVCSGVDYGKEITVNVGSGFSDQDRIDYYENANHVIGRTVEILCDVITQNRDGTYSLRFPRFVRFRGDK